jgi:hypothetical protein
MTVASVPAGAMRSTPLWDRIVRAVRAADDRELWFAWRIAFHRRFWKDMGARSASAVCQQNGIDHHDVLRRLTAYEFSAKRDKSVDLVELERELGQAK